ncbi:hypothetical protein ACFLTB_04275 [Chloroflexota bacterium]
MSALKSFTVGILCFILFLSLAIFGIAYSINSTVLNPDFVTGEINRLDVSAFAEEFIRIESPPEMPELEEVVYDTIETLEPIIKERIDDTIHAVYEYFPNDVQNLELNSVLRENFLTAALVTSVIDNIDVTDIAGLFISEQFKEVIPIEIENFDEYVEDAIKATEPAIKAQLVAAADPVFDYILGIRQTLNASISLEEITDSLKDSIRQSLLDSPPPELAAVPRAMRAALFDAFFDEIAELLPSTFAIDESIISEDLPIKVNEALSDTEEILVEVGRYVSYFQTAYTLLIVLMAIIILAVIAIIRDVRIITRRLGVPLITYGAIQYAGIWIARLVTGGKIPMPEVMPQFFETWVYQLTENLLKPVEIFSLTLLIVGIVLTIISYVYKRGQESELA